MEAISKKKQKNFHPDIGKEQNLISVEKIKRKNNKPRAFNKKRNPLSFVVDWQISDAQE